MPLILMLGKPIRVPALFTATAETLRSINPALNKPPAPEASKTAVNKETWAAKPVLGVARPVLTINNKAA
jgi:hypothetical protein